ncbi:MAG TPA: ATPase, T2SS/T4P/T4SS family [Desulfohalobiaceae bacterium]|nr:ATPase, T2SS/T4P/T4SS family [Desulfohalobiaceae bacterium]
METLALQELQNWANLSEEQVLKIKECQRKEKVNFIRAAVLCQAIGEDDYIRFCTGYLKVPTMESERLQITSDMLSVLPLDLCQKYNCIPFQVKGKYLFLAMADPGDILAIDDIRFCTGLEPYVHVASQYLIHRILEKLQQEIQTDEGDFSGFDHVLNDLQSEAAEISPLEGSTDSESSILEAVDQAPVVKMVNVIIIEAIRKKASDIHLEIYEKSFRVRFRLDGVLQEVMRPPINLKSAIISRIKIMANLNIAEKRLPQDGRIKVRTSGGVGAEFRVSVLPTMFGEKVVMRYLDKSALELEISNLGMDSRTVDEVVEATSKPHGMFLVTGPTGSGKTTTLYSTLLELNKNEVNISTVEDPVEMSLIGVNQVQINESIGLSFASVLRSFLRQDPDIILVGEIRDTETAQIGVKAALTGHLVLSTVHTNDAPSALSRLINMEVESYLLASAVNGVLAQRLLRTLCPHCKKKGITRENAFALKELQISKDDLNENEIFRPTGCSQCNYTGYKGRTGIYEMLVVTPEIQECIFRQANISEIKSVAQAQGMKPMRQAALDKWKTGIVSIEEVIRVTAS